MALPDYEVSTKPTTVADAWYANRLMKDPQDWEAFISLVRSRTTLTLEQILALDLDEAVAVINRISEGVARAVSLMQLGKSLGTDSGSD